MAFSQLETGIVPAFEILRMTGAVRSMIRDGRNHQISAVITIGGREGMVSMDDAILKRYRAGRITQETALHYCDNPETLRREIEVWPKTYSVTGGGLKPPPLPFSSVPCRTDVYGGQRLDAENAVASSRALCSCQIWEMCFKNEGKVYLFRVTFTKKRNVLSKGVSKKRVRGVEISYKKCYNLHK